MSFTRVKTLLDEYGTITRARLETCLGSWQHDAVLYPLICDYPRRGGRMLRSGLCIAAARAFGAAIEDAIDVAAALELLHNAFLVHDDVEDEAEQRRGRPSLNALHGVPAAVHAGDALAVLAFEPLLGLHRRLGPALTLRLLEETQRMARVSIEGQALELAWRRDNQIALTDEDYLRLVLKKTCWYTTIYPMRVGALIGTRGNIDPDRFLHFGFFLGATFQIQDDLLNLIGDPRRYGKEIDGDLWEGKRTLMLIHLLGRAGAGERERLREILAEPRERRSADGVRWMRERMGAYGSIEHAQRVAHALAGAAQHEFASACAGLPPSRDLAFIAELPTWVISRA